MINYYLSILQFKAELRENIKISSNKKFICLRIKDKIIVYSTELEIPIASLDIDNGIVFMS